MTPTAAPPSPLLSNIVLFVAALRSAGIPVSIDQSAEFYTALDLVDIRSRAQVYHAARSLLLNRFENLKLFDAIFNRFWRHQAGVGQMQQKMPLAPRHKRTRQQALAVFMSQQASAADPEMDVADKSGSFSSAERLQTKPFAALSDEELETVRQLMLAMRWRVAERTTRRLTDAKRGDVLHLRKMLRSATKYGGVPLQVAYQRRKVIQRPLVLLADVSGSMERYSRLLLQFFYALNHNFKQVETFVFGTRLTRISAELKTRNIDLALAQATRHVIDWGGGTRIGDSLHAFNRDWSRRVLRRGAVIIIVSDGCDVGEVERLSAEMRFLNHRSHRLIWLNPHLGHAKYRPLASGMSAAIPFIDDFLPIYNLQSLSALAEHLENL